MKIKGNRSRVSGACCLPPRSGDERCPLRSRSSLITALSSVSAYVRLGEFSLVCWEGKREEGQTEKARCG